MEIIFLSDILNEVVNPDLEGENLKRARQEETVKIKKLYDIFSIKIEEFIVKGKYHINVEYDKRIKWLLLHSGTYENRDKEIEDRRDIPKEATEMFRNCEFEKMKVEDLEKMVVGLVDGLLAFYTDVLSDEQRVKLQEATQKIYMYTRLYHRQLEEMVTKTFFNNRHLILDDKIVVYSYLGSILGQIGKFTNKLVDEIADYRESEEFQRACDEWDKLEGDAEIDNTVTMKKIEDIIFENSIEVLKEIIRDMEEKNKEFNIEQGEEYLDLGKWLQENLSESTINLKQVPKIESMSNEVEDLEFDLKCLEAKVEFLQQEVKRIHYTERKKNQIKEQIKDLKKEISDVKIKIANTTA